MTPRQAFDRLLLMLPLVDRKAIPGDFVARSGAEVRAALQELTSAEAANVRNDVARLYLTKAGFCSHGYRYSEQCAGCKR